MHGDRVLRYGPQRYQTRLHRSASRGGAALRFVFAPIRRSNLCSESRLELTTTPLALNHTSKIAPILERSIYPSRFTIAFPCVEGKFAARGREDKSRTERGLPLLLTARETGQKWKNGVTFISNVSRTFCLHSPRLSRRRDVWIILVGSEIFCSSASDSTTRGPFLFWDMFGWFRLVVFLYHGLSDFNDIFCWFRFVVFWGIFYRFRFVVFRYNDLSDFNGIFC